MFMFLRWLLGHQRTELQAAIAVRVDEVVARHRSKQIERNRHNMRSALH